jgi:hypothetical protein
MEKELWVLKSCFSMPPSSLDFLFKETIGIIGCGHLGRAIALQLVSRGYPSDRLSLFVE